LTRPQTRAAATLLFACALASTAEAQPKARVDLGSDVTAVGQEVRVGITLDSAGESVAAVEAEVIFPAALSFVEGELAEPARPLNVKLEAAPVETPAAGESRTLNVKIVAPDGAALPSGPLAVLRFRAPEKIEGDRVDYKLSHRSAITVGGRRQVLPPSEGGGVVTVLQKAPEVIACFFYMH
jgi:hypothetical protein